MAGIDYVVDVNNTAAPLDTNIAKKGAAELRAIKTKLNTLLPANLFIAGGTADAITGTLPTLANGLLVACVPPGSNTLVAPTLNGITIFKYNSVGAVIPLVAADYNSLYPATFQYNATINAGAPGWLLTNALQLSSSSSAATEQSLTGFYHPTLDDAYQACYRAGFLPSWFNQQWGGAQWGTLPDGSFGSVATGNIETNQVSTVGDSAGNYYRSQGFIVSDTATFDAVWVKIYKVGNPTGNITARIYTNSGGSPSAAIGSASTVSCKVVSSKPDGEWVQFTGLSAALTAGTQYHLTLQVAVDASNYIGCKSVGTTNKYPHGYSNAGTSVPAWTPTTTLAFCFLIQNPAANSIIQSGGMFDYKLAFNPGTPVNQSRAVAQPLTNFYDGKNCSVLYRGTYAVSTNVWDFTYGLDHDRITLTINGAGFPVLTIYRSDRTAYTITGTTVVTAGNHDVGIRIRTYGDGADYATLYIDGNSVGTPLTAQTFTMDQNLKLLGTCRLGDGFGIIPAWTQDMQMTSLPSAQGWTWTGVATEANAMSVSGGKLYQNATGYTALQNGYYAKTVVFANATGWATSWKGRVPTNTNTSGVTGEGVTVVVQDGTKRVDIAIQEYFVQASNGTTVDFTIQGDFKSQEHVFTLQGKGADYYLFIDGKLAIDGTGKLVTASATNAIWFGDNTITSGENADAIWSYVKYYQGGMLLPNAAANTCSEFAHWSGDKSSLFSSLYNSGVPVSVKQLCGVPRNYPYEQVVQREVRRGVTSGPTVGGTTETLLSDMEAYVIGNETTVIGNFNAMISIGNNSIVSKPVVDGALPLPAAYGMVIATATSQQVIPASIPVKSYGLGLRKVELHWWCSAGVTGTNTTTQRTLTAEARS